MVSTTVLPRSRSERITSQAARRAAGSKPVVGSSRKISSGSPTSASAKSSRRAWPPLSVRARRSAHSSRPGEREHLVDVARRRVQAGPVRDRLARRSGAGRCRSSGARCPTRARSSASASAGSCPSTRTSPRVARAVALEDLDRRRLAGAVGARAGRRPRRARTVKSMPRTASLRAVGLAQAGDLDRGDAARHRSHHGNIACERMLCGCIDIGTNTTRVLVAEARDGGLSEVLQRRAFTRLGRGLAPGGEIPARADRRDRRRRRRAARAGRAGWRATRSAPSPPRRSARAANRDEFCRRDARARRRRGLRARRRGGGAAGLPRRHADARAAARRAAWRSSTSAAARPRSPSARVAGGVEWSASFRVRLGLPRRRLPGRRTRRRAAELRRGARARRRRARRASTPRAGRRRGGGRRQRGLAAAARRRRARPREPAARAARALQRPGRGRRVRASTSTPSGCG